MYEAKPVEMPAANAGPEGEPPAERLRLPKGLADEICARLARGQRVRRLLPGGGLLHIDRQLPFLCVYRQPPDREDGGTERLVQGEASYLRVPGAPSLHGEVADLVRRVVKTLSAEFGAFLIVDVWAAPDGGEANDPAVPSVSPTFTVHAQPGVGLTATVEALENQLQRIMVLKQHVRVDVVWDGKCQPSGMRPLLSRKQVRELNCSFVGVAIPPVYRKSDATGTFPALARSLRQGLSLALRKTYFEFARSRTTHVPAHYHALGRRAVVKAVWAVDEQLSAVSTQFDYLLQLTPVNTRAAWVQFQRSQFEQAPEFHYRPLPVDPSELKRQLYKVPIKRVEDPALHRVFQEKQEELELKLTMLRDRDTPRFVYESSQLFGVVGDPLWKSARKILRELPSVEQRKRGRVLTAGEFAAKAEAEIAFYHAACPRFVAGVRVTDDVAGLIVSRGRLLINSDLAVPRSRVAALLAHEVGTHLVTYRNGLMQPFKQLYSGLAGYEELQEGLAVFAEYLVGGLTRTRLRQLAGRVVAVRMLVDGASFVDTFRTLTKDHGFAHRTAYNITMRVYRGGGLTKDAVYLRGFGGILDHVHAGGDLRPLLVGKMAIEHIPIIEELQYRKVLAPAAVMPRWLQDEACLERLDGLRRGSGSVMDVVREVAKGER